MSGSESDFNEDADEKLAKSISAMGSGSKSKRIVLRKTCTKVSALDLVSAVQSTRNLNSVKKELLLNKKRKDRTGADGTLSVPLHRLALERVESSVVYLDSRQNLEHWGPVVQENRKADQLVFPLEQNTEDVQSGTERVRSFKPRSALEVEMAKILSTSKNNLGNEDVYTEEEKEIIQAMSLKEAKAKCAQLQKMRALMSYRDAKLKRQAKIKSKSFRRRLKRQKRKQLIKEFDELMVKNPEAAKEKLEEIERQRILERATLKHRNGSKRAQLLARHASRDPTAKKALEEQIHAGRELVEKYRVEENSDDSAEETDVPLKPHQLLEKAADIAAEENFFEASSSGLPAMGLLRELRATDTMMNEVSAAVAAASVVKKSISKSVVRDVPNDISPSEKAPDNLENAASSSHAESESAQASGDNADAAQLTAQDAELVSVVSSATKRKQVEKEDHSKKKRRKGTQRMLKKVLEFRLEEATEWIRSTASLAEVDNGDVPESIVVQTSAKGEAKPKSNEIARGNAVGGPTDAQVDISLDPKNFLNVETSLLTQVNADLLEEVDEADAQAEQGALIAEAFEDDDVVGDFETEKAAVEEIEKPRDIDLTLHGWGSWTGPGVVDNKSDRFVIKANEKPRRDRGRTGVIISEAVDNSSVEKIQTRSVPFPFTTVKDYETVVRQPIGKDWNTSKMSRSLTRPTVVTKAGRIIKPLDKNAVLKERLKTFDDEEENQAHSHYAGGENVFIRNKKKKP